MLLWLHLILVSDQTGFPTWEEKYAYHMLCRVYFSSSTKWELIRETNRQTMKGLHFLGSQILEQTTMSIQLVLSEKLLTSQNQSAKL